ncbi:hypothetical protein DICVIV_07331 [Dictyocaulus viviparus]|uniref:Uncharacterized protein n=1 Tax=Dictyocaulus viviparus TaxID=29172 RepID=A0A0D8XPP8_DICVI|nr:hypothetical protein DICVIV_07331 [Dictyocaulus viviparus]
MHRKPFGKKKKKKNDGQEDFLHRHKFLFTHEVFSYGKEGLGEGGGKFNVIDYIDPFQLINRPSHDSIEFMSACQTRPHDTIRGSRIIERALNGVRMAGVGPMIAGAPTSHVDQLSIGQPIDITHYAQWGQSMEAPLVDPSSFGPPAPPMAYTDIVPDLSYSMIPTGGGTFHDFSPHLHASDLSSPKLIRFFIIFLLSYPLMTPEMTLYRRPSQNLITIFFHKDLIQQKTGKEDLL